MRREATGLDELTSTAHASNPAKPDTLDAFRAIAMAATPIAELLQLPRGERLALAMALWDSLDEEGRDAAMPLAPDLCEELDSRWATHQHNPAAAVPWEQVRSQLGLP